MNMPSDFTSGRSPRRELQGPRPAPLKVRKDSHKIKKPPAAPPQPPPHPHHGPHGPPRAPVIIYTVSPKIIHANPNEFMSLVQRLTGPTATSSSCTASTPPSTFAFQEHGGAISPAARFASIEKTKSPEARKNVPCHIFDDSIISIEGIEIGRELIQRNGQFPGILSPNPNTLQPIPPSFFSQNNNNINNPLNFLHDVSPVLLHSNKNINYLENNYVLPSPNFLSPQINMPSPNTLDLFNTLFDL